MGQDFLDIQNIAVPLSPDADDVEVGDPADLQLEAQLRHAARVRDLAAQDVALLLALNTLQKKKHFHLS